MFKLFPIKSLFSKKRQVSVADIELLKSFDNRLINDHLNYDDFSFNKLINQRGKSFVNAIKGSGLNKYEVLIISGYADFIASNLNSQLRDINCKRDPAYMLYENLLNKSLDKLEPFSNSTVYVMYQSNGDMDKLNLWFENRINETIQFPNFLSSSKDKWDDYGFYLQIQSSNNSCGKFIAPLTDKEDLEQEVTFKSNSKFKIESVNVDENTIYLSEIEQEYKANYLLSGLYYCNINNKEESKYKI